jgi:putative transposon-encoded protein
MIILSIAVLCINALGVTINETLDTTAPATNPAFRADTGTQSGRITRNGIASTCGSVKANPGVFSTTGARQFDDYRIVALSGGCVSVTISNAGNDLLFVVVYDQNGINITDSSLNYLADVGASPTTATPSRTFSFDVAAGQIFHVVVSEVNPAGAVGQTYTLDVGGVKIDPDFTVTEIIDGMPAQLNPAYSRATGNQTGRLNRFSPPSDCFGLKPNPGLFTMTGARQADLYSFSPAASGCARVTLSHTGADQAQIVVYNQNGYVPSNPSTNYLADSGPSAQNSSVTLSFLVTRGVPFFVVVSEVNPGAGIGDSYTLNISNVKLVPTVKITSTLDGNAPSTNPDFTVGTGLQTGRINRFAPVATCNAPKPFPGLFTPTGSRQYDQYTFMPMASGCIEVTLSAYTAGFDLYAVAYNNLGFNPANPGVNYLADYGNSPNLGNPRTFSFNVTAGVPFSVVVHEVNPGLGVGQAYTLEVGGVALNVTTRAGNFDFDGDLRTDGSIFRPSVGQWWYLLSSNGGNAAFSFGIAGDILVPADYTGDGKTDIAFFRPSSGFWFVLRSENGSFYSFPFGTAGDIPAPGDFDGDGKADPAVFRSGTWFILNSGGGTTIQSFGASGDLPVTADYDGDNKADLAIFRPSAGTWWINRSNAGVIVYNFGTGSDRTVQADYTGDGRADVAFFRPSTNEWFVLRSEDASFYSFPFGTSGDVPVPGDYDGDGLTDPAIFRPSANTWYKLGSETGFEAVTFGSAGDIAVPNAYVR